MGELAINNLLESDIEYILQTVIEELNIQRKKNDAFMNPAIEEQEIKQFLESLRVLLAKQSEDKINDDHLAELFMPFCQKKAAEGYYLRHLVFDTLQIKKVIWIKLKDKMDNNPLLLMDSLSVLSNVFDEIIKYMGKVFMEIRDDIIQSQKHALRELSVPVVPIFDDILILPLIGTIDTTRAKQIMENVLEAVLSYEAEFVLIDITGVPIVDTVVAHHIIKTVQAARLLGTKCILVGIRPEIANTIVELGVDLGDIKTQGNLKNGINLALSMKGLKIIKEDNPKG